MTSIPPIRAVRVLAVDPRPMMLLGIVAAIDGLAPLLQTIATATDYGSALQKATQQQPDIALLSLFSDEIEPLEAIRTLATLHRTRVVVLYDIQGVPVPAAQVLEAGAHGVLRSDEMPERIVSALLGLARAGLETGQQVLNAVIDRFSDARSELAMSPPRSRLEPDTRLTSRELEVVRAIVAKPSAKYLAIGEALNVSEHTVHNHLTSIYKKLNLVNRTDLLHYAMRNKLAGIEMRDSELDNPHWSETPRPGRSIGQWTAGTTCVD